jgi:hypothetical protein
LLFDVAEEKSRGFILLFVRHFVGESGRELCPQLAMKETNLPGYKIITAIESSHNQQWPNKGKRLH